MCRLPIKSALKSALAPVHVPTSARDWVLRNRNNFDEDLATMERTGQATKGVKTKCFTESRFCHRGEAYAADIHHDVLEGLIPGMLKPILQELVVRKNLVTVNTLNGRIANFDYNAQDIKNKPSVITDAKLKEDSRSLKQYAAQYCHSSLETVYPTMMNTEYYFSN